MSRALFVLVCCLIFIGGFVARASGGGGEAESAPAAKDMSSKDQREYREKSVKLQGLEARVEDLNTQLSHLVELKKREKNPEKVREQMDELVKLTQERNKLAAEHRVLKQELIYKFPNLGESIHRQYGTHEATSVDQLEKAGGLQQLLDETKALIERKYAPVLEKYEEAGKEEIPTPPPQKKKEERPLRLMK